MAYDRTFNGSRYILIASSDTKSGLVNASNRCKSHGVPHRLVEMPGGYGRKYGLMAKASHSAVKNGMV